MTDLASLTTFKVGGPAREFVEPQTEQEFIDIVRAADASATPVLVVGGGSNLLVADAGFDGLVIRDGRRDVSANVNVQDDGFCGGVSVTVAAGVPWDDVVALAVSEGWVGLEALSGIPGSTGASPVQNIGAYGAELSQTLATVRVWDRARGAVRTLFAVECGFGYRESILKQSMNGKADDAAVWRPTPRYVVLDVTLQMRFGTRSWPVRFGQLTQALGIDSGGTASTAAVREAVLELRTAKGMVLDPADPDTFSAGSFFTNPIVSQSLAESLPEVAPRYEAHNGRVKLSAAWLIENAGCPKGFAIDADARASLSTKHTLALTNRGGATAGDVVALARHVRARVHSAFGVELEPEPVLVGVEL